MKTLFLFFIGFAATCLLISASIVQKQTEAKPVPCACEDAGRYDATETTGGGDRIVQTSACAMIENFAKKTGANRGGFISKKVLDNIFCSKTFNGINFYFAMDDKEPNIVRLVVEGSHMSNTQPGSLGTSTERYINKIICPPSCGTNSTEKCK